MPAVRFLQALPILELSWDDITVNFIDGLPKLEGKGTILGVIGQLTKYTHLWWQNLY